MRLRLALVGKAILCAAEAFELRDVGPGDERLAARAAEYGNPQVVLALHARAGFGELLIHLPGHGIAGCRAIEDHRDNLSVASVTHFAVAHVTSAFRLAGAAGFPRSRYCCPVRPRHASRRLRAQRRELRAAGALALCVAPVRPSGKRFWNVAYRALQ